MVFCLNFFRSRTFKLFILTGMRFAERSTSFSKEALTFQILVADRTFEALRMEIAIQCLDPTIAGFNGETTGNAFGSEQLVPVFFAVG